MDGGEVKHGWLYFRVEKRKGNSLKLINLLRKKKRINIYGKIMQKSKPLLKTMFRIVSILEGRRGGEGERDRAFTTCSLA